MTYLLALFAATGWQFIANAAAKALGIVVFALGVRGFGQDARDEDADANHGLGDAL